MICFMFPGQPLARDEKLPDTPDFTALARLALDRTGVDIASWSWPAFCTENVALQVYGATLSLHRARLLRREGVVPGIVAEHSMGIYPALSVSGALPEGETLELTMRIGVALGEMRKKQEYALGCITGMTASPLLALAEEAGIFVANHNTSRHFLVAGERHRVEGAVAEALMRGAFTARTFVCDAPLHTPLVAEVEEEIAAIVGDYRYSEPHIPLMEHIEQDFLAAADIPGFLIRELRMPVYWEKTYLTLRDEGAGRFHEVGAGESLRKYNRWIDSGQRPKGSPRFL